MATRKAPAKTPAKKTSKTLKHVAPKRGGKSPASDEVRKRGQKAAAIARTQVAEPRRKAFVKAVAAGKSLTQAAKDAGYSPASAHAQGSRLHKDAEIQKAVVDERNRVAVALGITPEFVLGGIKSIAESNMQDFEELCSAESSAEMRMALRALPRHVAAAIQECTWETWWDKEKHQTVGQVRLKLYGQKLSAQEQLGKHINLHNFGTTKIEQSGPNGGPIKHLHSLDAMTDEQLLAEAARLEAEALQGGDE